MTRSRRITFVAGAAAVALFALALAGCTSDNQANGSAPESNGAGQGTVDVATSGLGQILVDSQGRTLYLFAKDTGPRASARARAPAPGLRSRRPARRRSVAGQTPRSWEPPCARTVAHRSPTPATRYLFSGDQNPGDTNGEGLVAYGAKLVRGLARGRPDHGTGIELGHRVLRRSRDLAEHGRQRVGRAPPLVHPVRSRSVV
jgi:predicted lipoprotein with Yx(FWY)xxD motif